MNISWNWLKEYIQLDVDVESVSKILTDIGLEVEGIEKFQTIKGGLEGIVVGKVLTCVDHPNSDHLHITTVDVGGDEILNIVCGAPNVAAGQTVVVATEGTKLYDGDKEFVIKKSKIRGEESRGMICAEDEIGIGTSHDGIMVLPDSIPAGTLASDYFNVKDDYIFEIGLTPNRVDAASHIGVARDIAAYLNVNGCAELKMPSVKDFSLSEKTSPLKIVVEREDLCPRYSGVFISGITVKESPEWLQNRLKSIGLRPINNVVDVTNFILHELCQPLHAFDADKIEGNEIHVKTVSEKTKFVTLDGVERELSSEDLMICNINKAMCIAGVFGGIESGVSETTKNVFLESAYFNPVSVRKTARRHGLSTDASFRYERGIDPNITNYALKRAALLIQEVAGGEICGPIFDSHPDKFDSFSVMLNLDKAYSLMGKNIGDEVLKKILKGLDIEIIEENNRDLKLLVPPYRVDVQRAEDVVEDVLRIYGYNNIEISSNLHAAITHVDGVDATKTRNMIADMLVDSGWYEIMNNSLTNSSYYADLQSDIKNHLVKIMNPLSAELDCLRNTMLFSSLEVVSHNINRQQNDLSLFEFGSIYYTKESEGTVTDKYGEAYRLSLCVTGKQRAQYWAEKQLDSNIYVLKSAVQKILMKLGMNNIQFVVKSDDLLSGLECTVLNNKVIARLGMVSKAILKKFDIEKPVYFAEIYWDVVLANYRQKTLFKELPQFPSVRRDLALLIGKNIQFEQIQRIAYQTEKKLLKQVNVFDVYEGKGVPEGKKSYAISFMLQDEQKTLNDVQIDNVMNRLIANYKKELGAELR
ncbi:MAG: phenylalanine--tRNA ligase subunit beta [Bacteroidales bacterium]|nr:phenylalanine--tRNA ligase subunit beta [Bacteroidales bacterium]